MSRRPALALGLVAAALAVTTPLPATARATVTAGSAQRFDIYHPPAGSPGAHTADEPSIGADWGTGAVMYQSTLVTYRVRFDDGGRPARATWTDVSSPLTSLQTLDPILFTDPATGRTFVSQLAGACSLSEYTDDDGASWTPSGGCGIPSGADHQSIGGGPFAPPLSGTVYPDAVYYCSQDAATAFCATSLTGGLTYGPGVPIYTALQCGGLHGHVRVGPDGTAVVPNQNCAPTSTSGSNGVTGNFTQQALVVSHDDGLTWTVHAVPDSVSTLRSDPAAAADSSGRWYFAYESAVDDASGEQVGGRAMVSTSTDGGTTWSPSVDVGAPFGIRNVTFPEVIAGDAGRAAYAFLGSSTPGDSEKQTFQGLWYLYVAVTTDAGRTWSVQNLTPGDPVERGCIFLAGTGDCPSPKKRNLYDFMDITHDAQGRVLVGYADGCTGTCVTLQAAPCADRACDKGATASTDHLASIARQTCGTGLLARFDATLSCAPGPASGSVAAVTAGRPAGQTAGAPAALATPNTAASGSAGTMGGALAALLAGGLAATAGRRRRRAA